MTSLAKREVVLGVIATLVNTCGAVLLACGLARIFKGNALGGALDLVVAGALRTAVLWGVGETLGRFRAEISRQLDDTVHQIVILRPRVDTTRLSMAADHVRAGVGITYLASSAACSILGVVGLGFTAGWLAVTIFVGLLALSIPFYIRAGRAAEKSRRQVATSTDEFATIQLQTLEAMTDMRSLDATAYASDRLGVASRVMSRFTLESIRIAMGSSLVTDFIGGAAIGLVAMVVGFDLLSGRRSLEAGLVALWLVIEMNLRIRLWAGAFHQREDAVLGEMELSLPDEPHSDSLTGAALVLATGVRFPTFAQRVSLSIVPGQRYVITGPSGVGKTRLLRALVGIEQPIEGSVATASVSIGWVQSSSQLLPTTLRDNLDRRGIASTEEIRLTLHNLGLDGERFRDLDARVNSADQFSDGERARLAIARALLADVRLLVIDDVAGLFDGPLLQQVATEISQHPELAIIEAAHRRRILAEADQVLDLEFS